MYGGAPRGRLLVGATALSIADDVLFGLGAGLVIVVVAAWMLRFRRDPLAEVAQPTNRLEPAGVLLPMLVWMFTGGVLSAVVDRWFAGDARDAVMIWSGNVAQALACVVCLAVASRSFTGGWKRFLLGDGRIRRHLSSGVGYFLAALAVCPLVLYGTLVLLNWVDPQYPFFEHEVIDALRADKGPRWTLWLGTVLIAPIAEECFFRGLVLTAFANLLRSRWVAVILTAAVFGAVHAGGGDTPQPHVVPALTLLGVLLGVLYLRTGALVGPITLHALFNAKTLLWASAQ